MKIGAKLMSQQPSIRVGRLLLTNPFVHPVLTKSLVFTPRMKVATSFLSDLATPTWKLRGMTQKEERLSATDIIVTTPAQNTRLDTGLADNGAEEAKLKQKKDVDVI